MSLTIFKSSAGSGKTFTLVSEYLRLIINNIANFRQILAITFTNKAANEMKDRIMTALEQLSDPERTDSDAHKNYLKLLVKTTGLSEASIHKRAAQLITQILHNYSDVSVSTIDSFTQRVIRSFTHDLGLPQGYEVELDTNSLLQRAVDRLMNQIGIDSSITPMLVDYCRLKIENEASWQIERDLLESAKVLFDESDMQLSILNSGISYSECRKVKDKINCWRDEFSRPVIRTGKQALQLIDEKQLSTEHFFHGDKGIINFFKKLTSDKIADAFPLNTNVIATLENGKWYSAKATPFIKQQIDSIRPDLERLASEAIVNLEKDLGTYILYGLISKELIPAAVMANIQQQLDYICLNERILPISIFNKIVASVTLSEPVPFIFLRIGERYNHYMIDEFQDTSVLQWNNLIPLIDDSLAQNNFNLIVGDAKQAIYRWRNGEAQQFVKLPELFDKSIPLAVERERNFISHCEIRQLNTNYRSQQVIVDFNNRLFEYLKVQLAEASQPSYNDVNQTSLPSKPGGYIELEFHDRASGEFNDWNLTRVRETILDLLNDGFFLSDIAILCRSNSEASSIAAFLLSNGIDVISAESLQISTSPQVRLIAALMRIIESCDDQMAFTEAVFLVIETMKLSVQPDLEFLGSLMISKDVKRNNVKVFEPYHFVRWLNSLDIRFSIAELSSLPLYERAEALIRILGYNSVNDIFLQFFLEALHDGVTRNRIPPSGFRKWWVENGFKEYVNFPEGSSAVQVMTIHKAKGLQFNVVICPLSPMRLQLTRKHAWINITDPLLSPFKAIRLPITSLSKTCFDYLKHQEIEKTVLDNVNLLYVVLTRAVERLYVFGDITTTNGSELMQPANLLFGFLKNEQSGWNIDTGPFIAGTATPKVVSEKVTTKRSVLTPLTSFADWRGRMRIGRPHGSVAFSEKDHARVQGMFIHEALSKLNQPSQLHSIAEQLLAKDVFSAIDQARTIEKLREFVAHPLIEQMFKERGEHLTEPTILIPDGSQYRPDRVVVSESQATVYEFKTGLPEPEHSVQLKCYIDLLRNMGYNNVKGKLLYFGDEAECIDIE